MRPKLKERRETAPTYRDWRAQCLRDAGFEPSLARRLALDTRFDLHELLELVDRGCPPALAARIVAPLDQGVSL